VVAGVDAYRQQAAPCEALQVAVAEQVSQALAC
jgi:hypothetical protein